MGRAGIEPATLGLEVRLESLQVSAGSGNRLHTHAFYAATNCLELHRSATNPYSQRALVPIAPRIVNVHSSSGVWGVGLADRTGSRRSRIDPAAHGPGQRPGGADTVESTRDERHQSSTTKCKALVIKVVRV